ncbi:Uncharacterised protein [Burkholderia pseudomallei]|nr:Uncharacterised protein [Burkholderia pseudomallei]
MRLINRLLAGCGANTAGLPASAIAYEIALPAASPTRTAQTVLAAPVAGGAVRSTPVATFSRTLPGVDSACSKPVANVTSPSVPPVAPSASCSGATRVLALRMPATVSSPGSTGPCARVIVNDVHSGKICAVFTCCGGTSTSSGNPAAGGTATLWNFERSSTNA